jgi:hypothetical protein
VKFETTMSTLGELVKEDVKLGTLFMFLVLMTPGNTTSSATRVSTVYSTTSLQWRAGYR